MRIYVGANYLFPGFRQEELLERAATDLVDSQFDAVVVTGVSGLLAGPLVAHATGKPLIVVRKPEDVSGHSRKRLEGFVPAKGEWKWLFVDDFIATGETLSRVASTIRSFHEGAELIGAWEYARRWYGTAPYPCTPFTDIKTLLEHYPLILETPLDYPRNSGTQVLTKVKNCVNLAGEWAVPLDPCS